MRSLAFVAAALAVACSTRVVTQIDQRPELDAGDTDAAPEADSDVPDAEAPTCPQAASATTCVPVTMPCAKGVRYGCYGAVCPIGDVGSCRAAGGIPNAMYSEVCCERAACVRTTFGDRDCQKNLDGSPIDGGAGLMMWSCPLPNQKPPGTCALYGASPGVSQYCCR